MATPTKQIGTKGIFLDNIAAVKAALTLKSNVNKKTVVNPSREKDDEDAWEVETVDRDIENFDAEMIRLYQIPLDTINYIAGGGTIEEDPALQRDDLIEKRRILQQKRMRMRRAQGIFKLNADLVQSMETSQLGREHWEKRYSARHNQRYWRHKETGITRLQRPYLNPDLLNEEDSTEESEVSLAFDSSSEASGRSDEESGEEDDEDSSDDDASNDESSTGSSDISAKGSISEEDVESISDDEELSPSDSSGPSGSSPNSTNRSVSSFSGSDASPNSSRSTIKSSVASPPEENDDISTSVAEDTASSSEPQQNSQKGSDSGIWEEKMSNQWGIPYWQNKSTRHVIWHCPSASAPGSPLVKTNSSSSPKSSRYYVTQLISLETKAKEREKRQKRRLANQWIMKYSTKYDAFYYKNAVTHDLAWEDPRPQLLDPSEFEEFLAQRSSLRASMRVEALGQFLNMSPINSNSAIASSSAIALVDKDPSGPQVRTLIDPDDETVPEMKSDINLKDTQKSGTDNALWRAKWSEKYGCYYYKNSITGAISYEDPMQ